MQLRISPQQIADILVKAQAVEAELLRFIEPHEIALLGDEAFSAAGSDFNQTIRTDLHLAVAQLEDAALCEIIAIWLVGDGTYSWDEFHGLVAKLEADFNREENREKYAKMIINDPCAGSTIHSGATGLGLLV
jgi:hypothetical protein